MYLLMRGGLCGKLHGGPLQLLFVLQQSSTLKADIRRGCIRRPS